ncbi:MAG TPA: hypothetical protein VLG68_00440 [Gammaproteobacteria bacterium]|nr:hypothetical protein [Gammaproteobacteria bacterium]
MHAQTRFESHAPHGGARLSQEPDEPLAQVELLLLFHPRLQGGPRRVAPETYAGANQAWLTLDVRGTYGTSELTGRPILEDLRLETHGEDLEALLPDEIVNEIAAYVLAAH